MYIYVDGRIDRPWMQEGYASMPISTCVDKHAGMCTDMCADTRLNMHMGMRTDTCMGMCV